MSQKWLFRVEKYSLYEYRVQLICQGSPDCKPISRKIEPTQENKSRTNFTWQIEKLSKKYSWNWGADSRFRIWRDVMFVLVLENNFKVNTCVRSFYCFCRRINIVLCNRRFIPLYIMNISTFGPPWMHVWLKSDSLSSCISIKKKPSVISSWYILRTRMFIPLITYQSMSWGI